MNEENVKTTETDKDQTLLLVSGIRDKKDDKLQTREYVKKLSNAVSKVYYKHGLAKLRCVGAASLNNAIKAFIIAKNDAKERGENIRADMNFTTVSLHGENITAIVIEVSVDNCPD